MEKPKNMVLGLTTKRIESLTDGVFAIAMTLLVLNLNLPPVREVNLHEVLLSQLNQFGNYVLSFILLGIFWIVHHQQFHSIHRSDRKLIWINIFILMFIALVPFSTSLADDFSDQILAKAFFNGNLFVLGMLFVINWIYATAGNRLVPEDLPASRINTGLRRTLILPTVSLLAMGLSFLSPGLSSITYLLIPFILSLKPFRHT